MCKSNNSLISHFKKTLFLYLKWCVAQQDFSQLLTNESVRVTYTTIYRILHTANFCKLNNNVTNIKLKNTF